MNLTRKITLIATAVTTFAVAQAQEATGFLGQRYTDINFGLSNDDAIPANYYDAVLNFNIPLCKSADLGLGYAYDWLNGNPSAQAHSLLTSATYHTTMNGIKPFVSAGLGYQWSSASFTVAKVTTKVRDNDGIYGFGFGAEIPVGSLTVTPSVSYSNQFDGSGDGSVGYGVEAARWFSNNAVYAGIAYQDDLSSGGSSAWTYRLGFRAKF